MMLSNKEQLLILLLLSDKSPTEDEIDFIFEGLDIDDTPLDFLILLANLGLETNWKHFPKNEVPRLRGTHSWLQTRMIFSLRWLFRQIELLNEASIPVIAVKGLAMKYFYNKDSARVMWDFDLLVPEDEYDEAVALLDNKDRGTRYKGLTAPLHGELYSDDDKVELPIELHKWIFKTQGDRMVDLFSHSVDTAQDEVAFSVLEPYYMLVHMFSNFAYNSFTDESSAHQVTLVYDILSIMKGIQQQVDYSKLMEIAQELGVLFETRYVLDYLNEMFPELIDMESVDFDIPATRRYVKWVNSAKRSSVISRSYHSKHYSHADKVTPRLLIDNINYKLASYDYLRRSYEQQGIRFSFWEYIKYVHNVVSMRNFLKTCWNVVIKQHV